MQLDKYTFAVDVISFKERKSDNTLPPPYFLKNYNFYEPKLEDDFYYMYFLNELLFSHSILEIEDFLNTQFNASQNRTRFIKILNFLVLPAIDKIVENAKNSIVFGGPEIKAKEYDDGFIEFQGVIKNTSYSFEFFYNITFNEKLKKDLEKRKTIIETFIIEKQSLNAERNVLKWIGKPSHLAYVIRKLVDEGYIEAPQKLNKEINFTELSRQIINSFNVKSPKENTLRSYSSVETQQYQDLDIKFTKEGFHIPDSGSVS
ncbi:hypothetical protein JQC67_03310 [Aurantibacter crassamenti]|uniref:hypothetical protein n=1 Tax=Aurantibacter crassamenti TaxID=1837375 RepID=UPI0019393E88|nr:hypothetical protein [Aurantibacter crassamenti]MBM1105161.1 hypothetical protein [Aurantibacter crassamenti]